MTTYVSYSLTEGAQVQAGASYYEDDITVGTLATNSTGVVELRMDVSTVTPLTRRDIDLILQAFRRRLVGELRGSADTGLI